jgi:lipopolysaccharide assembly protein A
MRIFAYIFWIIVVVVGLSFAAINSSSVEIHYYVGSLKVYLPLLLLMELVIGAALGIMAILPRYLKTKSAARKAIQKIKRLENDITTLQASAEQGDS